MNPPPVSRVFRNVLATHTPRTITVSTMLSQVRKEVPLARRVTIQNLMYSHKKFVKPVRWINNGSGTRQREYRILKRPDHKPEMIRYNTIGREIAEYIVKLATENDQLRDKLEATADVVEENVKLRQRNEELHAQIAKLQGGSVPKKAVGL